MGCDTVWWLTGKPWDLLPSLGLLLDTVAQIRTHILSSREIRPNYAGALRTPIWVWDGPHMSVLLTAFHGAFARGK